MSAVLVQEKIREETTRRAYSRPIMFDEFVELCGPTDFVELVGGSIVEMNMVHLDHELLERWLFVVLHLYVSERKLGTVLHSRIAVKIDDYHGRLPDILFVRNDRLAIVQQKGVVDAPDLVIEIISPNDRAGGINERQSDYERLGVSEIVFIDQSRRQIRILRRGASAYNEAEITSGAFSLETIPGVTLQAEWLFGEPRPGERAIVDSLIDPTHPDASAAA